MLAGRVTLVLEGLAVNREQFGSSPIPRFLALISGSLQRVLTPEGEPYCQGQWIAAFFG
jgi:hypothetical protein